MGGQIERGHDFGDALYEVASRPEVRKCLEVGTLHGDGSTWVVAQALARSSGLLHSIELKEDNYRKAVEFYSGKGMPVELHHGLSLTVADYDGWDEYWAQVAGTRQERLEPGSYREWFDEEMELARGAERVDVVRDLAAREGWFDLVVLDGGEFASNAEFRVLQPHIRGWVFMDDTNRGRCIKNALARSWILASDEWEVVRDEPEQRNGWIAARKVV
ncbi:MAG: hypothetical protein IBX62_05605 [Coriobacteriia bacterium]|nr:hypothetical protein [Coriobacteriia bacterium]